MTERQKKSICSQPAAASAINLPCPFCGYPCDDCANEDGEGYLGCGNDKCPASRLAMTHSQWNTRVTGKGSQ